MEWMISRSYSQEPVGICSGFQAFDKYCTPVVCHVALTDVYGSTQISLPRRGPFQEVQCQRIMVYHQSSRVCYAHFMFTGVAAATLVQSFLQRIWDRHHFHSCCTFSHTAISISEASYLHKYDARDRGIDFLTIRTLCNVIYQDYVTN